MATEAQINANRANAKASTGPKTEDGKAKAARNNTKFGLFATNNCVQPHEKEDYDHFCDVLWSELAPLGGIEEVTAAEYVRNAWRLRRCTVAEESIGARGNRIQADRDAQRGVERPMIDPVLFEECLPTQTSIDRARVQAQNGMRRAKADLDKIQTTRKSQPPQTDRPEVQQVEPNPESNQSDLIRSESRSGRDTNGQRSRSAPSDPGHASTGSTIRSQSDPKASLQPATDAPPPLTRAA